MEYKLLWSEDNDEVGGLKELFKTEEEFINQVKEEYRSFGYKDFAVENVRVEACISTEEGFPSESIIPLSETNIVIENYYLADVTEIE